MSPEHKKEFEKKWILYDIQMLIYFWNNVKATKTSNCHRKTKFPHSNSAKVTSSQKSENDNNDFNSFGPGGQKCLPF